MYFLLRQKIVSYGNAISTLAFWAFPYDNFGIQEQ